MKAKTYPADRYVTQHDSGETVVEHVDGIPWHEAAKPGRWHKCWAQTRGWTGWFNPVYRCPCGAISRDGILWLERRSRK